MATTTERPEPEQLRLNEHARVSDPDTSRDAAASLNPAAVGAQIARVVIEVANAGIDGRTCDEIVRRCGGDRGCTARRITDARQRGLVRDSGRRRKARSGRDQIVWILEGRAIDDLPAIARRFAEANR